VLRTRLNQLEFDFPFPWRAASDLVGRQLHYGKHEVFTMTHCGEGRGVGMRPPNQKAPLYAGEADRTACMLLMRQHDLAQEEQCHIIVQLPAAWWRDGQRDVRLHRNMCAMTAGNTCEPWMARFAIVMLDQLLHTGGASAIQSAQLGPCVCLCLSNMLHLCSHMYIPSATMTTGACHARVLEHGVVLCHLMPPHATPGHRITGMKALEWGTGSSTQWTLMRVGHLTSIEHDTGWAPAVREAVGKTYDAGFLTQVGLFSLLSWSWLPHSHVPARTICKSLIHQWH
jgi:hypothetical protein